MQLALVYFQEQKDLNTNEVLQEMKLKFEKENWELSALFVDHESSYEKLIELVNDELRNVDILFLYSKYNIIDEFYWELLVQTADIENVRIEVYIE